MNLRLSIIGFCLLLFGAIDCSATSCERLESQPDAWVTAKADALVRAAHSAFNDDETLPAYYKVLDGIAETIQRCDLSHDGDFVGHYREFVDYVVTASLGRLLDHELGFNVPDKRYFEETRDLVQVPDFLLDPGFLRNVSRLETLDRAKSFLRLLNLSRGPSDRLIFFSYKSRHLGTPDNDNSYRRLLIVVPGNAEAGVPEKWVQFGVTDRGARVRVRNVSVVSAMVSSDGTFDTYFKDFYRTYHRDGSIGIKGRWELGYGDDNCAQCHKSGVLPIFPVAGSVSPDERQAVLDVNERFRSYGSPRFGKYLDETKFGPGLGSSTTEDRIGRFGDHFAETAVSHAMSCSKCHAPEGLGSLNWPMDQTIINSFVTGGQMPWGNPPIASHRTELYWRLVDEYFAVDEAYPGILKSWLLGKRR